MDKSLILTRAKSAAIAHDFATATRLYKELLRDDESNVEYLKQLGSIYVQAQEDEKAIPYYQQIITFYPHYVEAMNSLGAIYRRLKRYEESIEILQRALDEDRQLSAVNYNLGFTYREMGNYADAIDSFQKVISVNPDDVLAYNHLGAIYTAQQEFEKAISSYKRGLQIDRNHPILNYNLAKCYEVAKNPAEAVRCYQSALKTRPNWTDAIKDYTSLLMRSENNKEAAAVIQQGIILYPNNVEMLSILGDIYLNEFDYSEAEKIFKKASNIDSKDVKSLVGLAKALEKQDKSEYALDAVNSAIELDPENKEAKKQYAQILLSEKDYEGSRVTIEDLYNKDGEKDLQVLDLYAQYYICKDDEEKAKEFHNSIKRINHHYKDYMINAANRFAQIGKYEKAEVYANEYIVYRPDNVDGYNTLGKINYLREDFNKASEYYEKALQLGKNNGVAEKQLKTISDRVQREKLFAEKVEEIHAEAVKNETGQNEIENIQAEETDSDEFDFSQMGSGAVPLQEGLLETEEDFWKAGDDEKVESEPEPQIEEDKKPENPVLLNMEEPAPVPKKDDFAQQLADSASEEEDFDLFGDSADESKSLESNLVDDEDFNNSAKEDYDFEMPKNISEEEPLKAPEKEVIQETNYETPVRKELERAQQQALDAMYNAQKMAQQMADQQQRLQEQTEKALQSAVENAQRLAESKMKEQDKKLELMLETAVNEQPVAIQKAESKSEFDDLLIEDEPEVTEEGLPENIDNSETELIEPNEEITQESEVQTEEELFPTVENLFETLQESIEALDENDELRADVSSELMLEKIMLILNDDNAAINNALKIEMFKKLRKLCDYLPENEKDNFQTCRNRMVIEYIISKLSGKPGLLLTTQSLIKSGVLGQEYATQLTKEIDEELSNDLIRKVILQMKRMSQSLEDTTLANALCASADNILERIELINKKNQIF